jgi:ABC-type amino acid transport substrate-binding protein
VFNDRLNTLAYMQTHHGVKIVGGVFDPAGLGIAVRKGDQELSDYVNGVLQSMQASGELARLQRKWIGSE